MSTPLTQRLVPDSLIALGRQIRLLALDVDGTLTDGRLLFADDGTELKAFHVLDGQGLKLLERIGVAVALITARTSSLVERRAADLGIPHVTQGCHDKGLALQQLVTLLGIPLSQSAFMGDDLPDLSAMRRAGLSIAPANAHPWVAQRVHLQTASSGGQGAVREVCDWLIEVQQQRENLLRVWLGP